MGASAWGALIGAGLGGVKSQEEQAKAREYNALAAQETAIAPLFSMQTGQVVKPGQLMMAPSELDRMMQGAQSGAQFGSDNAGMFGGSKKKKPQTNEQSMSGSRQMNDINLYDV